MTQLTDHQKLNQCFTVNVFKKDGRCKKGEKRLYTDNKEGITDVEALRARYERDYPAPQFRVEVYPSYVEKINHCSRQKYIEHVDTPACCSPACETYWCM